MANFTDALYYGGVSGHMSHEAGRKKHYATVHYNRQVDFVTCKNNNCFISIQNFLKSEDLYRPHFSITLSQSYIKL